jgi:hypothetical protein
MLVSLISFTIGLRRGEDRRSTGQYPEQLVQLSNSAMLLVHGTDPDHSDEITWDISYRAMLQTQEGRYSLGQWEKAGTWFGGIDGNVVACPLRKVVFVALTNGKWVFIRTEAGRWIAFNMEIPAQSPFPQRETITTNEFGIMFSPDTSVVSLDIPAVQELRARMSAGTMEGAVLPDLAQFLPERRELWVDYITLELRRFRVRLRLSDNGEKFRLIDVEEHAFDRNRSAREQFGPDIPLDPICDKVAFSGRVPLSDRGGGFAMLADPQHPSDVEFIDGWRIRNFEDKDPKRIYLVLHGERRLIPTTETYQRLFGGAVGEIHRVGKNIESIPEGDPFSLDAGICRSPGDLKTSLFDTGEYHWIKSSKTLNQYGFDKAPIHECDPSALRGHIGEDF